MCCCVCTAILLVVTSSMAVERMRFAIVVQLARAV